MAYVTIDGVKYEKELLDLAKEQTTGRGNSKISKEETLALFESAADGNRITETEKKTLEYIRKTYPFTDPSAALFDEKFAAI